MSSDRAIVRTRDPVSLKVEYAIGLTAEEATGLRDLLCKVNFDEMRMSGESRWSKTIEKLDWLIKVGLQDEKTDMAKNDRK